MQLCIRVVNSHIMAKFQWQLFLHFKGFGTILWIELEKCSVCANISKAKAANRAYTGKTFSSNYFLCNIGYLILLRQYFVSAYEDHL